MALCYDLVVSSILVKSLGEKIHKCVLSLIFSAHVDVIAIDLVISLSFTLKYNLHLVGIHVEEDAMSAIITPRINLCTTMHDNICHIRIVGECSIPNEFDGGTKINCLQSFVAVAESFALNTSNVLREIVEIGIGKFETVQECTLTYGFQVIKMLTGEESCQILVVGECVLLYLCYLGSIVKNDVLQVAVLKHHLVDYRHISGNSKVGKFATAEEGTIA